MDNRTAAVPQPLTDILIAVYAVQPMEQGEVIVAHQNMDIFLPCQLHHTAQKQQGLVALVADITKDNQGVFAAKARFLQCFTENIVMTMHIADDNDPVIIR